VIAHVEPLGRVVPSARRLAIAGLVLGALAFWIALPPVHARSVLLPVVFGALAAAIGLVAWRGGATRLGWSAVVVGGLGLGLGYLATRSSIANLQSVFTWSTLLASALVFATPLTYAALGGMVSERSGVVNIGLEGMMLMGAFWGIYGADKTGSWELGILIGMFSGGMLALVHAFFSIQLRADQIVGGTAINFLALGITGYFFVDLYSGANIPSGVPRIPAVNLAFLKHIPPHTSWYGREIDLGSFLYESVGHLNLLIWVALALVPLLYVVVFKTPIGLRIRACGEHPRAADTVGIDVYAVRYGSVITSGVLSSLGGAFLSVGFVGTFNENMTSGRGFIALAAMIFGNWRPLGAFGAGLLFGFSEALAFTMQVYSASVPGIDVLINTLPYFLTLIAVAGVIGRTIPPAADGKPYKKQ
jgi:simple sugar transport system permease protein